MCLAVVGAAGVAGCAAPSAPKVGAPARADAVHPIACPVRGAIQPALAVPNQPRVRSGLAIHLVPPGPTYATICRYAGLNVTPDPRGLVRSAELVGPKLEALVALMNSPDRQIIVHPEYYNCPLDDGQADLVEFYYAPGPAVTVTVEVTGCGFASNGVRTVAGYGLARRLAVLAGPGSG